jgi:hypothetical protein
MGFVRMEGSQKHVEREVRVLILMVLRVKM